MTKDAILAMPAGEEMDRLIHVEVLRQVLAKSIGVRPYSRNLNWAKVAQLDLTVRRGRGTLIIQNYTLLNGTQWFKGLYLRSVPPVLEMYDDEQWVSATTEELVICRLLLLHFYGF